MHTSCICVPPLRLTRVSTSSLRSAVFKMVDNVAAFTASVFKMEEKSKNQRESFGHFYSVCVLLNQL